VDDAGAEVLPGLAIDGQILDGHAAVPNDKPVRHNGAAERAVIVAVIQGGVQDDARTALAVDGHGLGDVDVGLGVDAVVDVHRAAGGDGVDAVSDIGESRDAELHRAQRTRAVRIDHRAQRRADPVVIHVNGRYRSMGIDGIPVVHDGSRGVVGLIEDVVADHRNIGIGTEIVVLSHDIRLTRCHEIEIPDGVIAAHAGVAGQYVEARAAEQAAAGVDRGPVLDLDADIIASKVVTLNLDCRLVSLDADARAGVNVVACDNGIAWRDKEEGDTNMPPLTVFRSMTAGLESARMP